MRGSFIFIAIALCVISVGDGLDSSVHQSTQRDIPGFLLLSAFLGLHRVLASVFFHHQDIIFQNCGLGHPSSKLHIASSCVLTSRQ
ncbi:hypothetical protein V8F33_013835 [Rhypophila sp. PSN 637]